MKRGVVMSIHKKHAIVLTADGQFLQAPIQDIPEIGEEITFDDEQFKQPRRFKRAYWTIGAAAMICMLLAALLMFSFSKANPVVAYLVVDINPSVEIGVDEQGKVRELRALNNDGELIIEGIAYRGVHVEMVAASIFEKARSSHYFDTPNKDIIITSVNMKNNDPINIDYESILAQKLDEMLHDLLTQNKEETYSVNIMILSAPQELRAEADANGISSGKMAVYLMAKSEGYELELEQMKQNSIDVVTEPIGGVKHIVENADDGSKQKLQELLKQEQEEKAKVSPTPPSTSQSASASKSTSTSKPNDKSKSASTTKPKENAKAATNGGKHTDANKKNTNSKVDKRDKNEGRKDYDKFNRFINRKDWVNENGKNDKIDKKSKSDSDEKKGDKDKNKKDDKSDHNKKDEKKNEKNKKDGRDGREEKKNSDSKNERTDKNKHGDRNDRDDRNDKNDRNDGDDRRGGRNATENEERRR